MRKLHVVAAAIGVLSIASASIIWACGGTTRPPCSQTVYWGGFVESSICHVGVVETLQVPVRGAAGIFWGDGIPGCPTPSSVEIETTLEFTPLAGGAPIPIAPVVHALPLPVQPGLQDPILREIPVPGSLFDPMVPYTGTITTRLEVEFVGGSAPTLSDTVVTEICLLPKSPHVPDAPELELVELRLGGRDGVGRGRRGDLVETIVALTNNNAVETVECTLSASGTHLSKTPDGGADIDKFALGDPLTGTDSVNIEIVALSLQSCDPIALPGTPFDPTEITDRLQMVDVTLAPGQSELFVIQTVSHGMCADGSCSEVQVRATGTFQGIPNRPAQSCLSFLHLTDDVPARSDLQEITDTLKTDTNRDSTFGTASYGGAHDNTFFAGNQSGPPGSPSNQTTVAGSLSFGASNGFPDTLTDTFRGLAPPTMASYEVDAFAVSNDSFGFNSVRIMNTGGLFDQTIDVPLILPNPPDFNFGEYGVMIDTGSDSITIVDEFSEQVVHSGPFSSFGSFSGNQDIVVEPTTCRTFTFGPAPNGAPLVCVDPQQIVQDIPDGGTFRQTVDVFDAKTGNDLVWFIDTLPPGVEVRPGGSSDPFASTATGAAGQSIELQFTIDNMNGGATRPPGGLSHVIADAIRIESAGSLNNDVGLGFAVRPVEVPTEDPLSVGIKVTGNVAKPQKGKAKITIDCPDPFAPDADLAGEEVCFDIGGNPRLKLILDNKDTGQSFDAFFAKDPSQKIKVKRNKKKGTMKIILTTKKSSFTGLAANGLEDGPTIKGKDAEARTLPVTVTLGGAAYGGEFVGTFTRKEGKKFIFKFKTPKQK